MSEVFPLLKTRSRPLVKRARRLVCKGLLGFIAEQPCAVPGCRYRATVHHLRCAGSTAAAGRRSGDDEAVPLCAEHHQGDTGVHKVGEAAFWSALGIDALALAGRLRAEFERGGMP